ncbi:MAG: hypothetical protein ACR2PL_09420 [Dehalococcoidia bacterium]
METTIAESEPVRNLTEILDRVRVHGEEFSIESDGAPIAVLGPAKIQPAVTLQELEVVLAKLPRLDEVFAADIESVKARQGPSV